MAIRKIIYRAYRYALWNAEYLYALLLPGTRRAILEALEEEFQRFDAVVTGRLILFHIKNHVAGEATHDAPVAFVISTQTGERVLQLGVDIRPGGVLIRQMQGMPNSRRIKRWYDWQQRLLKSCEKAAAKRKMKLRIVSATRIMKSRGAESYTEDQQRRLIKRYDHTPLERGYTPGNRSHRWNPDAVAAQ